MDLLALSCRLVPAAAVGKAVGTWAAQRQFGGVDGGRFAVLVGTVGSGGQIQRSHQKECAHMGVVGERAQGFWLGARWEGEKLLQLMKSWDTGVVETHLLFGLLMLYVAAKKYGEPMILRWSHTNLGSL